MQPLEYKKKLETITPIYDELRKLYAKCPSRNMQEDLLHFLKYGYIFSGPNYLLIGERVGLGWFIHAAIGRGAIRKFGELMPYYLPFIGWAREAKGRSEIMWHNSEIIFRRLNMKLTPEQEFERCRFAAANLVAQYRAKAPEGFDVYAFGGGVPKAPKPPAPPTPVNASQSLLNQGKARKKTGYASTVLTTNPGDLMDKLGG